MAEENIAVNIAPPAAEEKVETTSTTEVDAEARIAELELERDKAIIEAANYKLGMLKAKGKATESFDGETEEERIARIVSEKLSETKIAQIDVEKESLLKKIAKENKELKLALLNKNKEPSAMLGTHNESQAVRDTAITPEQMAAFKRMGWSEKEIERYKKNLQKNSR